MKKEKIMQKLAVGIVLLAALAFMGCGGEAAQDKDKEASGQEQVTAGEDEEATGNETENEVDESGTAEAEETTVEEIPIEKWIASIKTNDVLFFIFNETTGERRVLEDGEEYAVSKGDVLGLWYPNGWESIEGSSIVEPITIFSNSKLEYQCILFSLDDIEIMEEMCVVAGLVDTEGNEVIVTIYLTSGRDGETSVEETEPDLSNEEWVKSLKLEKPTFLVFNDTTGERKVLEDGQEYIFLETDVLACWRPSDFTFAGIEPFNIVDGDIFEKKYGCMVFYLNYEAIGGKTEVVLKLDDDSGNEIHITVYLTKAQTTEY